MQDKEKSKEELIRELEELRTGAASLGALERELEQTEDRLQAIETRHKSLLDSSPDPMVVYDNKGIALYINSAFTKTFGWTLEEVLGKRIDYVPEEFESQKKKTLQKLFNTERVPSFDTKRLTKDGRVLDIHISSSLFKDREGKPAGHTVTLRDVTEAKRAQQSLEAERAQLLSIFDSIDQIIYVTDPITHEVLYVNKHGRDLLGKNPVGGICYKEFQGLEAPCDFCTNKIILGQKESPYLWEYQNPILKRDFFITDRIIKWPDGRDVRFELAIDITEQKRAEQALLESEERYRLLAENSIVGVYLHQDDYFVYVNDTLAQLLGYASEEMSQKRFWEIFDPELQDQIKQRGRARYQGQDEPSSYESRMQCKNGEFKWVEVSATSVKYRGNMATLGTVTDITERKRAELALRESEERFRQMAETMEDVFWMADWETRRVLYVNPAYGKIWGRSAQKIVEDAREWANGIHVEDRKRAIEIFLNLKEGETYDETYRVVRPDGSLRWVRDRGYPVRNEQGKIHRLVGTVQDITDLRDAEEERTRLEKQLREAQKMEAIGTLAGGIAHDFNNLLQIVLGYSELLIRDKGKERPGHRELQAIRSAAERGADLVKRLLTFSRRVDTDMRTINLNDEVQQVGRLLYRTIPKMIEIQTHLDDDLKTISADSSQVEQILLNLAVNAKEAMPDGGKLVFETNNVFLDEEYCNTYLDAKPGEYVRLKVSDTGYGMAKEVIERIFEPFYTTKKFGEGTGLGLSMVFGIVKIHGGHITCCSEPGAGTMFSVYFPIAEPVETPDVAASHEMPAFGTETILLVDDEELIRDLGKQILSRAGYTVITAASGQEALDLYEKKSADISLVILDLIMPEMGGRQCLDKLLKIDSQVKILIASGFAVDSETKTLLNEETKGSVGKPFKIKELLRSVRRVLDGNIPK